MAQERTIKVALDADIQQISQKIQSIQNQLNKLNLKQGLQSDLSETITRLQQALKQANNLMGENVNASGMKKLQKEAETVRGLYNSLERQMSHLGLDTSGLKKDQKAIDELASAQERFKQATKDSVVEQKKLQKALETAKNKTNKVQQRATTNSSIQSQSKNELNLAVQEQEKANQKVADSYAALQKRIRDSQASGKNYSETDKRLKEVKNYNAALVEQEQAQKNVEAAQNAYNEAVKKFKIPSQAEIQVEQEKIAQSVAEATRKLEEFNQVKQGTDAAAFQKVREELEKIQGIDWKSLGIDLSKFTSIEDLNAALQKLGTDSAARAEQAIKNLQTTMTETQPNVKNFARGIDEADKTFSGLISRDKEVENFRQRLIQFFSIGNSVRLFQRAIRSAFETVKELDEAMTEIAVVSDFSISDMWAKLPEFTKQANELGVAIKDTYEATTLFVQQGLDLQNSVKLSTETLKMARIAGMDAASATDAKFHCVA